MRHMNLDPDTLKTAEEILNSKMMEKSYDDLLSTPLKETSKMLTYFIKTLQLLCFSLQCTAAVQERLEEKLRPAIDQVPEENRIAPPSSIAVPIMQHLSYIEDGNILIELFQNLLARAMDKARNSEAHPAFINIIQQLSPDEALLLFELKISQFEFVRIFYLDIQKRKFYDSKLESNEFNVSKFLFPDNFDMYLGHLYKLDLTDVVNKETHPIYENGAQTASRQIYTLGLTKFGELFVRACFQDKL